jgi:hypothetical protein
MSDSRLLTNCSMFCDISTSHVYEVNQRGIVRPGEPAGAL